MHLTRVENSDTKKVSFLAHIVYEVRTFSVLENRENGLGDEGVDGGNDIDILTASWRGCGFDPTCQIAFTTSESEPAYRQLY